MEIVFFVNEFPPFIVGGLGTYAKYITREFVKLGHDVTVFSMDARQAPTRDICNGVEVYRPVVSNMKVSLMLDSFIPDEVRHWSEEGRQYFGELFLFNLLSARKLINELVKVELRKVDLVVAHDWLSSLGGMLSSNGLDKPLVFHVHSTEEGRTNNGSITVKRMEQTAVGNADRVITVSYAMRDHLMSLGYDDKKIRVVHNGIDIERYSPEQFSPEETVQARRNLGITEDEKMILFVGRLTWVKGADTLLQAMPQIIKKVPETKLVIIGIGDQQEMLKHDVIKLGLQDNVILKFKFLDEPEKIKLYSASDVCVFPSKYEPFGIVCTEAMSMGKPVVVGAKGVSGFKEQVVPSGPNQSGFHIDPFNPNDISEYTLRLLEDDELRKRCGENARKRAMEVFSWRKVAKNTINVYQELL
jgi:glycosyltransferase involved in cell wall biosynthesis